MIIDPTGLCCNLLLSSMPMRPLPQPCNGAALRTLLTSPLAMDSYASHPAEVKGFWPSMLTSSRSPISGYLMQVGVAGTDGVGKLGMKTPSMLQYITAGFRLWHLVWFIHMRLAGGVTRCMELMGAQGSGARRGIALG